MLVSNCCWTIFRAFLFVDIPPTQDPAAAPARAANRDRDLFETSLNDAKAGITTSDDASDTVVFGWIGFFD
jgi:hypothetical protein